jgi:MarR family protein
VAAAVGIRAERLTRGTGVRSVTHVQTLAPPTPVDLLSRIRLVARTLECEPGLTSRELAERGGLTRRHMALLLLRLEEHGLVMREGRRWFPGTATVD